MSKLYDFAVVGSAGLIGSATVKKLAASGCATLGVSASSAGAVCGATR
jgi:nucleoside-diphosphate-sugar epimerase